ncbi:MAG TPA: hypothetical protein DDW94_10810 [Deltaproteobacteria bacterium]|nr:MAG: hypothetical protein A2Z79_11565 [Deltaproteobacteria bacterium GWA2_55_82]OGQ63507.1 MAG: hypothetical protein A3I81_05750 [Deltaproteobacteria bacterium RIFCSPLOWO2_02_FULL_55_12]OIJ74888.1 MAG: hypothetical protein A2V21_311810 [Deltaproteobacteria bacterium GWC2_55_46]HBG47460.1 hypothetical protein [Deltaproteobacteria bacterium]HCY11476.1 hypothetical protein [Deltaproteobacteria bacterium]
MKKQIAGLSSMRTCRKVKIRSAIGSSTGGYLDLYIMDLESRRFQKELLTVEKRKRWLESELKRLGKEQERVKKEMPRSSPRPSRTKPQGKALKTMIMDY